MRIAANRGWRGQGTSYRGSVGEVGDTVKDFRRDMVAAGFSLPNLAAAG